MAEPLPIEKPLPVAALTIKAHTPTNNRELAQVHARAVYKKTDRRALMISMFAFFATILTLGGFVLANSKGFSNSEPEPFFRSSAEPDTQAIAEKREVSPNSASSFPSGTVLQNSNASWYDDASSFGQPMSDWADDAEGGWGVGYGGQSQVTPGNSTPLREQGAVPNFNSSDDGNTGNSDAHY